jgi:hypothetical protein
MGIRAGEIDFFLPIMQVQFYSYIWGKYCVCPTQLKLGDILTDNNTTDPKLAKADAAAAKAKAKSLRPWFKKKRFIIPIAILAIIIISSVANAGGGKKSSDSASVTEVATQETTEAVVEPEKPAVPAEYASALIQAQMYSDTLHMSKAGLFAQLTSEYGGQFTPEAAQYGVDNVKADFNANALAQAKQYVETLAMSPAAVYDQLISEYGGQFTPEEAQYAVDNLNK